MPKEGFGAGHCQSFFGYDFDYKIVLCCLHRLYSVVDVIPKEGLVGPACQSFSWYDTDKDLNRVHFLVAQLIYDGFYPQGYNHNLQPM